MNRALFAAATGMDAQQRNLDVIANNLANAGVNGFKGSVATFGELANAGSAGLGTQQLGTHVTFEQGKLVKSGGPFDMAIDGDGFFAVTQRGRTAYTRDGSFSRVADGTLVNAQGWTLKGVRIPADAASVTVSESGAVLAKTSHGSHSCGTVRVAQFAAPEALVPLGGTLFEASAGSGKAHFVKSGSGATARIAFGMLEQSNVSIIESMMEILSAQRAYEANAKGIQAADEMLRIADNLNRG